MRHSSTQRVRSARHLYSALRRLYKHRAKPLPTLLLALLLTLLLIALAAFRTGRSQWRLGFSKVDITPQEPVWLSGFSWRVHGPNSTAPHVLYARAVALRVSPLPPLVIVALDLVGLDRSVSQRIHNAARQRFNLTQLLLVCSHTHSGPVVGRNLYPLGPQDDAEYEKIDRYTSFMERNVIVAISRALANLRVANLHFAHGKVELAVNRRQVQEKLFDGRRGETDDSLPVIWFTVDEEVVGGLWGYTAHATVLTQSYYYSGDYPGKVSAALEYAYEGSTWLYLPGCGGDQNIYPRGTEAALLRHTKVLETAVVGLVEESSGAQRPMLHASKTQIGLGFEETYRRGALARMERSLDKVESRAAKVLWSTLNADGVTSSNYSYPISVVLVGDVRIAFLGGEPTVRFAALVRSVGVDWVVGYTDDVMGYIATRKDRKEGGREGSKRAAIYYGLASTWKQDVEDKIVQAVQKLTAENG